MGGIAVAYLSLYRKYRPQTFQDVVGQSYVVKTLENALATGRINHAYLFTGPRGTGKTTLARLLAKGLNCEQGPTAEMCDSCENCQAITEGRALNVMEIDGASNRGIEEVRELREQARYAPTEGRYKVYIIDEVHMLTTEAFNALLKTLEEPPEHVVFMFATTDPHKIPATILSRCQRYDLKRFPVHEIETRLEQVLSGEGLSAEPQALALIARHAEGGMRDALGILDQCLAYTEHLTLDVVVDVLGAVPQELLEDFVAALANERSNECLQIIDTLYEDGKDILQFTRGLIQYLRDQLQVKEPKLAVTQLFESIEVFAQCERDMRYSFDTKLQLELAVMKFVDLPNQWRRLEKQLQAVSEDLKVLKTQGIVTAASAREPESQLSSRRIASTGSELQQLGKVKDNWEEFLLALRGERLVQSEAFLREGAPVKLTGNTVTLAFPKERGFHKASIEQEKHRVPAERVLSKFFGRSLELNCVIGNADEYSEQPPPNQPEGIMHRGSEETRLESNSDLEKREQYVASPPPALPSTGADANKQTPVNQPGGESKKPEPDPLQNDTVQAALKAFGGRVVRIDDGEKGGV